MTVSLILHRVLRILPALDEEVAGAVAGMLVDVCLSGIVLE